MRRATGLLSTALVRLLAVGLVLAPLGCESENAVACQGFVAHYQGLACTGGAAPDVDCNAFADYPCPIEDYFTCLEQGHTCNEQNELVVDVVQEGDGGTTTCADLLDCER